MLFETPKTSNVASFLGGWIYNAFCRNEGRRDKHVVVDTGLAGVDIIVRGDAKVVAMVRTSTFESLSPDSVWFLGSSDSIVPVESRKIRSTYGVSNRANRCSTGVCGLVAGRYCTIRLCECGHDLGEQGAVLFESKVVDAISCE